MNIIELTNNYILSPVMLGVLFICGAVLLWRLKGFPLSSPVRVVKNLMSGNILASFRAMTVALAGTLGVGNIVGVASAIHMGGAGAVLWMLISALVSMVIKYAEIYLAMLYRKNGRGGAAYYIKYGMKMPLLASVFSLLCIIASFTVGNIIQVNAVADSFESEFGIPPVIVGAVVAVLAFLVICRGIGGISSFTVKMIPILTAGFLLFSFILIFANIGEVPRVLKDIFSSAFHSGSAAGGVLGFLTSRAVHYGVVRGIGSNEAGCGTAPTAHATAEGADPEVQGCWGVFEVFCDTVLICTVTAVVILIYPVHIPKYDGMVLAIKSYESFFGDTAGYVLSGAIFFFALSTVICWSYYGSESAEYLGLNKKTYHTLYCLISILGAVMPTGFVWELSDMTISFMTVINCICIISLSALLIKDK